MTTDETRTVARAYFDAWTTRQGPEALRPLMTDDFTFRAGDMVIEGRERFFEGGSWPDAATTRMVAEAYDGETAIQMYESTNGPASVVIADHLIVRDGRVASASVVCDGAAFAAFMAGVAG